MTRKSTARKTTTEPRGTLIALCVLAPAIIAGLAAAYLLASRRAAGEFGFPLDDSWIHVRFAQNLARGQGFSFNPATPTSTTTGALWTLLLAGAYRLTHEFLFTSIVVNGLLAVGLCAVVYGLALTLTGSRWTALAAGVMVAVTAPLPWWVLSGMEPPLYATLAMLGVLLYLRTRRGPLLTGLLSTVVFALAGLARPECFLLFPVAMIDRLVMAVWVEKRERAWVQWAKEMAIHVPVFAVIAAPLFAYNLRVTGMPLPSSFYSKQQWMSIAGALAMGRMQELAWVIVVAPWQQLWSVLVAWARDNALLIAPFFAGLGWLIRDTIKGRSERGSLLIPMALVVQPMVWAWFAGYRAADYQSQRYIAGLNPLYLLVGVVGGWWLLARARSAGWGPRWAGSALAVGAIAVSLAGQPATAVTYAQNVKNITEMQVTIARWVKGHAPKGSLLAVNDVGAIGVIADDPVLDLQGLVTPEVLPLRDLKRRVDQTAPALLSKYVFDHRPDYLIIFPQWHPEMDQRRDVFEPVFEVQLADNITCGAALMRVYRTVWAEQKGGKR